MYLRLKFEYPRCFYYFLEENIPFRGFDDESVDLRRGGFDVAGVVDARFEGAACGRGREDRHGVVVERHCGYCMVGGGGSWMALRCDAMQENLVFALFGW